MRDLNSAEMQEVNGGIALLTPFTGALLLESSIYGPLTFAFGAGYAVGTFLYDNYIGDMLYGKKKR